MPAPAGVSPPISRARAWLFRILALVLAPLLAFGALELGLRVVGYGHATSFLQKMPAAEGSGARFRLQTRASFGWRFFPPTLARRPALGELEMPRPASTAAEPTVRVVVLGGSAALGIPDPAFGAVPMLELLLGSRWPDHRIEVLNAGMTAINSHVVLPIARDVVRARPDVAVIYMGNNEVVGPWGAGSVFGSPATGLRAIRMATAVRATRSGQWLAALGERAAELVSSGSARGEGEPGQTAGGWRGMAHFVESRLPLGDPALDPVYVRFRANLEAILDVFHRAGIPVVLSTVAVDRVDTPPLASVGRSLEPGSAAELRVREAVEQLASAWPSSSASDAPGAPEALEALEALEIPATLDALDRRDPGRADVAYLRGRYYLARGELARARSALDRARDLDALRFRADSRIEEIILQVAAERLEADRAAAGGPAVRLVDAQAALDAADPSGLAGRHLFWEHVHPTPAGNYALASAWVEAVEALSIRGSASSSGQEDGSPAGQISFAECLRRLGHSEWRQWRMASDIADMMEAPPFPFQLDHRRRAAERRQELARLAARARSAAGLETAEASLRRALGARPRDPATAAALADLLAERGDGAGALELRQALADRFRRSPGPWTDLGNARVALGQWSAAEEAYGRAAELDPYAADIPFDLGLLELKRGRFEAAIEHFDRALALDPGHRVARLDRAAALDRAGRSREAFEAYREAVELDPEHAPARVELGARLAEADRTEEAAAQYRRAIELQPSYAPAHFNLALLLERAGQHDAAIRAYAEALRQDPELSRARDNLVALFGRLGAARAEQGDLRGAADAFRRAIAADPDHGPSHFNLARALLLRGRRLEAIEALRTARERTREHGPAELLPSIEAALHQLSGEES